MLYDWTFVLESYHNAFCILLAAAFISSISVRIQWTRNFGTFWVNDMCAVPMPDVIICALILKANLTDLQHYLHGTRLMQCRIT